MATDRTEKHHICLHALLVGDDIVRALRLGRSDHSAKPVSVVGRYHSDKATLDDVAKQWALDMLAYVQPCHVKLLDLVSTRSFARALCLNLFRLIRFDLLDISRISLALFLFPEDLVRR